MTKEALVDSLRSCDIFFYTYTPLKFKGSNKYRTTLGGLISLGIAVLMMFYLPDKILTSKDSTYISMYNVYHNLSESIGPVTAQSLSFDFAIAAQNKTSG